jgi:hypothetical protein
MTRRNPRQSPAKAPTVYAVAYAYPTSPIATSLGRGGSGAWFVAKSAGYAPGVPDSAPYATRAAAFSVALTANVAAAHHCLNNGVGSCRDAK